MMNTTRPVMAIRLHPGGDVTAICMSFFTIVRIAGYADDKRDIPMLQILPFLSFPYFSSFGLTGMEKLSASCIIVGLRAPFNFS